jgi:hypothetical protein
MEQSVPNRRHIKFRRQGIAQKNAYVIYVCKLAPNNTLTCKLTNLEPLTEIDCEIVLK